MEFYISNIFTFIVCLSSFSNAEVVKYDQRQFSLKFLGSLKSEQDVLFSGEGNTFLTTINNCVEVCRGDSRCIGMEVCKITEDSFRCRACCKMNMKVEAAAISMNETDNCKYLGMDEEPNANIAVNKPASMSSIYGPAFQASNAVDNATVCPIGRFNAHTERKFRPWIQIDLQSVYDVNRVIIYNRQDGFGSRLHDVQVIIGMNGTKNTRGFYPGPGETGERVVVYCTSSARGSYVRLEILSQPGARLHDLQVNIGITETCGFYPGPGETGERIVVYCTSGARGSYVRLEILSQPGTTDILTVCEIEIFVYN